MSDRRLAQSSTRRVAAAGVAGVAGLATVLVAGAGAHAEAAPTTHGSSAAGPVNGKSAQAKPRSQVKKPAQVAADFGNGKVRVIRVGMQIDPAADVPNKTNTFNSQITIVETGASGSTEAP